MKKLTLIAALASLTGVACYGQASNILLQANDAPGALDDSLINGVTISTTNQWATTYQANGQYAGGFYTSGGSANDNTGGNTPSGGWDIYAGPGSYADMYHTFDGNLVAGETVSFTIALGSDDNAGGSIGFNLVQNGGSYTSLFSMDVYDPNGIGNGGAGGWSYLNGDLWPGQDGHYNGGGPAAGTSTSAGYNYHSTSTFTLTMTDSSGDYSASMVGISGTADWTGQLSGAADNVDAIRIFNNSAGGNSDVVINSLQVSGAPVPEPSSLMMLLSSGFLGSFYLIARRRK